MLSSTYLPRSNHPWLLSRPSLRGFRCKEDPPSRFRRDSLRNLNHPSLWMWMYQYSRGSSPRPANRLRSPAIFTGAHPAPFAAIQSQKPNANHSATGTRIRALRTPPARSKKPTIRVRSLKNDVVLSICSAYAYCALGSVPPTKSQLRRPWRAGVTA
ncbi:hypothetical protein B0H16DRAFT_1507040 [Mycena metata]|uniref:Uncharacterized protein n=1 Tax=Mycena metata TaxID=1033252 RepID=A0AAD7JZS9_9AGAR|nr:hypothetical protein B0H16DRAFT_1507040 [Mycena metata]